MEAAAAQALLAEESAVVASAPAPAPPNRARPPPQKQRRARERLPPGRSRRRRPPPNRPRPPNRKRRSTPPANPKRPNRGRSARLRGLGRQPGLRRRLRRHLADALPLRRTAPEGPAAHELLAARHRAAAERHRPVGGQPPSAATKSGCPTYEACLQDVETLTLPDQLAGARLTWHGYFEAMTDAEGKADNCVHPEPEAADVPTAGGYSSLLNPFVFFHSLLDLGDCDENDVPIDRARQGPEESRGDRQLLLHLPQPLQRRRSAKSAPKASPPAPPRPTPSSPKSCRKSSPPPPTRRTAC